MKIKLKTPKPDESIKNLTKLSKDTSKFISDIKKIQSGDETPVKTSGSFKKEIICPECKRKLKGNNPNRIPNHAGKSFWYLRNKEICRGSWSKQHDPSKDFIEERQESSSPYGLIKVGDKFIVDFTRAIFFPLGIKINEVKEVTLEKITQVKKFNNDGTPHYLSCPVNLFFEEFPNIPIPNFSTYTCHIIPKNKF